MLAERLSGLINRFKYQQERHKESMRFNEFFTGLEDPNGILTKTGKQIHPIHRGLITARGSFDLRKKVVEGKTLSEEECERVREAAWLTSLTGNYTLEPLSEGTVRVGITLEDNKISTYLARMANTNNMVAFLSYNDANDYRHKEASSITAQEENKSHIIFDFPKLDKVPTIDIRLFICSQLHDVKNIDPRFSRINLLLYS